MNAPGTLLLPSFESARWTSHHSALDSGFWTHPNESRRTGRLDFCDMSTCFHVDAHAGGLHHTRRRPHRTYGLDVPRHTTAGTKAAVPPLTTSGTWPRVWLKLCSQSDVACACGLPVDICCSTMVQRTLTCQRLRRFNISSFRSRRILWQCTWSRYRVDQPSWWIPHVSFDRVTDYCRMLVWSWMQAIERLVSNPSRQQTLCCSRMPYCRQ